MNKVESSRKTSIHTPDKPRHLLLGMNHLNSNADDSSFVEESMNSSTKSPPAHNPRVDAEFTKHNGDLKNPNGDLNTRQKKKINFNLGSLDHEVVKPRTGSLAT